jgi:hypothetical protein
MPADGTPLVRTLPSWLAGLWTRQQRLVASRLLSRLLSRLKSIRASPQGLHLLRLLLLGPLAESCGAAHYYHSSLNVSQPKVAWPGELTRQTGR